MAQKTQSLILDQAFPITPNLTDAFSVIYTRARAHPRTNPT